MATEGRITWQNVAAPDFRGAGDLLENAGQMVGSAFNGFLANLDKRAKLEADNANKVQDYWTKMAEIPLKKMGVADAVEAAALDTPDLLARLALPTTPGVVDVSAINKLVLSRLPEARKEAADTYTYNDNLAAQAELPFVTQATEMMVNNPTSAVKGVSGFLSKLGKDAMRPTTQASLLQKAYELENNAITTRQTRRLQESQLENESLQNKVLQRQLKEADSEKAMKLAQNGVGILLAKSGQGYADIDLATGAEIPRGSATAIFEQIRKEGGESTNIKTTKWSDPATWTGIDPTDSNTLKGLQDLDTVFGITLAQPDGKGPTIPVQIPSKIVRNLINISTTSDDDSNLAKNASDLVTGINAVFAAPGGDLVAAMRAANVTDPQIQELVLAAVPAMDAQARLPSVRHAATALITQNMDTRLAQEQALRAIQVDYLITAAKAAAAAKKRSRTTNTTTMVEGLNPPRKLFTPPK